MKKNKPQTYLVDISANVTQRKATAIHPLDEGRREFMSLSQHKTREEGHCQSDLENKQTFL